MYQNVYKYDDMKRSEHMAVRKTFGWYYFTHQIVEVIGQDCDAFLDEMFANPVANLKPGRARYTTMLNEHAEIIDDVVVFRMEEKQFWVSTLFAFKMLLWFDAHKGERDVAYKNITEQWDMYAVQGPKSRDVINSLVQNDVNEQKFFEIRDNKIGEILVKISRAGFTGEKLGFEIYVSPEQGAQIEDKLKKAAEIFAGKEVTEFQVMTLTLPAEKGFYCMRDLMHTNPFEVGLEHGIDGNRSFIGKEALADIREKGAEKEMVGFNVNQADVQINSHSGHCNRKYRAGCICETGYSNWSKKVGQCINDDWSYCEKAMSIAFQFSANSYFSVAIRITQKWCYAHRKTKVDTDKQKLQIHDDGNCGDTVFTGKGECSAVKYDGCNCNSKLIDKFGCTIYHTMHGFPQG